MLQKIQVQQLYLIMSVFILLLVLPLPGKSQSMQSIVLQLPQAYVPDLDSKQRQLLLKKVFYELPGGDSEETIQYELDTPVLKNYIHFGFNFTTGQAGFGSFELKRFKRITGQDLIIFSRFGGASSLYEQHYLKIFFLDKGKLTEDRKQKLLPQSINLIAFLKKQTPDSIRKKIEGSINSCYSLDPEKDNQIEFNLSTQFMDDSLKKWLLGDSFIFTWNERSFSRKLVFAN